MTKDGLTLMADHETKQLLDLFPPNSSLTARGELAIGGCPVTELAERYGTPALVIDEAAVRARARRYADGLAARWENSQVVFASKAFPCTAVYRLIAEEGLGTDVAGGGELALALAAGADPAGIVVHGNAKTEAEIRYAVDSAVGLIVIDDFDDIDRLEKILTERTARPAGQDGDPRQGVLVRLTPDIRPDTHAAVSTGQRGSKFGMPLDRAARAVERLKASRVLRLDGVHVHVGSQILDTEPFELAVRAAAQLGEFDVYDLGGGLGARYTYDDHPPSIEAYLDTLVEAARRELPAHARLLIEPGRSMVAETGATLYRVATVKHEGDEPPIAAVDGGMGDNLEVALYDQRFEATVATRVGGGRAHRLVGRHCESGDVICTGTVPLRDPEPGDLIAVPVTGAYTYSMSNNYNGALRPPVIFCRDGHSRPVVRRETYADLARRDIPPS
ncbi:MAG TPA: diaminopimelate decarboxylase [Actinospica sp.]|jgi:diaminopimelate decarboxylase|nr:diaminopimelate decarboxylase [Actinospica sp.]